MKIGQGTGPFRVPDNFDPFGRNQDIRPFVIPGWNIVASQQAVVPEHERIRPLQAESVSFPDLLATEGNRFLQERTAELETRVTEARDERDQAFETIRAHEQTLEAVSERLAKAETEIESLRAKLERLSPAAYAWYALLDEIQRRELLEGYGPDERESWDDYASDNSLGAN